MACFNKILGPNGLRKNTSNHLFAFIDNIVLFAIYPNLLHNIYILYIYIFIYTYKYIYNTYIYIYVHTYINSYIYIYLYTYTQAGPSVLTVMSTGVFLPGRAECVNCDFYLYLSAKPGQMC